MPDRKSDRLLEDSLSRLYELKAQPTKDNLYSTIVATISDVWIAIWRQKTGLSNISLSKISYIRTPARTFNIYGNIDQFELCVRDYLTVHDIHSRDNPEINVLIKTRPKKMSCNSFNQHVCYAFKKCDPEYGISHNNSRTDNGLYNYSSNKINSLYYLMGLGSRDNATATEKDEKYKYKSLNGAQYQYDLSKPYDKMMYQMDLGAQLKDSISIDLRRDMDRRMGQYGGGIK